MTKLATPYNVRGRVNALHKNGPRVESYMVVSISFPLITALKTYA